MLYILAIVCPPLAILLCGKPFQAIFSIVATLFFWVPGVLWAFFVVSDYHHKKEADRVIRELKRQGRAI